MKGQIHLLDLEEPTLKEGRSYRVNCERELPSVATVFIWHDSARNLKDVFNNLQLCPDCRDSEVVHRYVYGLVSRDEIREEIREVREEAA